MRRVGLCFMALSLLLILISPTLAAPTPAEGVIHIVQRGQTLSGIALRYGVDAGALARANNIVNPNHIYVGQRLVIPATAAAQPTAGTYVVQVGDTLFSIGRRYGVTAWAIAQANGIYNMNTIYVGQRLTIPGTGTPAATPSPAPTPAASATPAPTVTAGWQGAYYRGTEIAGAPVFVRTDRAIDFRWGERSPDTRLDTDNFAVQWTRAINFQGGLYRFTITADDGARLWVDGKLVLDAWDGPPGSTHEVELVLTPGQHLITVDYFEATGRATIMFNFKRLGAAPVAPTTPAPTAPGTGQPLPTTAWLGEYFGNQTLEGAPVVTRIDEHIGFEWGLGSPVGGIPENHFSVRWTRQAHFYYDNYAFCAMSDDGVRIYVDDVLVLDEWHGSNGQSYCAEADLREGMHTVKVEYYEDGGEALIYVWWERR